MNKLFCILIASCLLSTPSKSQNADIEKMTLEVMNRINLRGQPISDLQMAHTCSRMYTATALEFLDSEEIDLAEHGLRFAATASNIIKHSLPLTGLTSQQHQIIQLQSSTFNILIMRDNKTKVAIMRSCEPWLAIAENKFGVENSFFRN